MNIIELMQTVGIETFVVAFEEIFTACKGGDDGYGALGTLLGDLDTARAIVNHFSTVCKA